MTAGVVHQLSYYVFLSLDSSLGSESISGKSVVFAGIPRSLFYGLLPMCIPSKLFLQPGEQPAVDGRGLLHNTVGLGPYLEVNLSEETSPLSPRSQTSKSCNFEKTAFFIMEKKIRNQGDTNSGTSEFFEN